MTRNRLTAALVGTAVIGTLAVVPLASPANAEPGYVPGANDVVGVGSDTTQFALNYLADGATVSGVAVPGYNAGLSTGRISTFDALGVGLSAQITPKQGAAAITRPNGSGAGKGLLYGVGDNTAINFARSSSSLSATESNAGLWQVPFAVDGLKLAVSAASTHAPAFIAPADMVKIYDGTYTNWTQLGGTAGTIKPLIPQAGSGTRSFFVAQLKAANGGTNVVLGGAVTETQEHSDTDLKSNPDAVAPFSTGRAKTTPTVALLGGTAAGGFEAKRALYNVVRQADLSASWFAPIFGPNGFICSTSARPLIENAGFDQLATAANAGVCGEATQAASTNFTTNQAAATQATATTVTATATNQSVQLRATVAAAAGTPVGSVEFFEGATSLGAANLAGGVALKGLTGVTPGSHVYSAKYTPANANAFYPSQSAGASVAVMYGSTTTNKVPAKFKKASRPTWTAKVLTSAGTPAAGKVVFKLDGKKLATKSLSGGKASVKLPKLKKGKHKLVAVYNGDSTTTASSATKKVVAKA